MTAFVPSTSLNSLSVAELHFKLNMRSIASSRVVYGLQSLQSGLFGAGALHPLKVIAFCVFCLLGWRLWRFTIRPYMEPQAPKELPYWIPCECIGDARYICILTSLHIVLGTHYFTPSRLKALTVVN